MRLYYKEVVTEALSTTSLRDITLQQRVCYYFRCFQMATSKAPQRQKTDCPQFACMMDIQSNLRKMHQIHLKSINARNPSATDPRPP